MLSFKDQAIVDMQNQEQSLFRYEIYWFKRALKNVGLNQHFSVTVKYIKSLLNPKNNENTFTEINKKIIKSIFILFETFNINKLIDELYNKYNFDSTTCQFIYSIYFNNKKNIKGKLNG